MFHSFYFTYRSRFLFYELLDRRTIYKQKSFKIILFDELSQSKLILRNRNSTPENSPQSLFPLLLFWLIKLHIVLPVFEPYVDEITQYILFYSCLLSLITFQSWKFLYIAVFNTFHYCIVFHCMILHQLFIYFNVNGHLRWFHLGLS